MNDTSAPSAPPDAFSAPAATALPPRVPVQAAAPRVTTVAGSRSPALALLLSFFIPGAGQLYNGEIGKGIAFIVGNVVACLLTLVVIGFFLLPVVWVWSLMDAYQVAKRA